MLDFCRLGWGRGLGFVASLSPWREHNGRDRVLYKEGDRDFCGNVAEWDQHSRERSLGSEERVSPDALLSQSWPELPRTHWVGKPFPWHCLGCFFVVPTFVDLDKDDVLELVLGTTDGNLSLSSHSSFFIRVLHLNIFRPSSVSLEFFTCIGSFFSIFLSLKNSPHQGSCSTLSSRTAPFSASRRRLLLTCPLKVPLVRLVSSLAS